jgi:protease PrsW
MKDHLKGARESVFLEVGGVVLFVLLVAAFDAFARPVLTGPGLLLAGVVLAVVPAAIWLIAFYRQDRLEPEPRQYVIGVYVLGALLAQGVGQPLLRDGFEVQNWPETNPIISILGAILVVGLVQEFLKYAAVRYTVFASEECDQQVDGIIYAASAGLGYATMLNIHYVLAHEGVDLTVGAVRCAVVALAHASFAGVTGYFLGRAKCGNVGPFWLAAGIFLAATLNGIVTYVLREVTTVGNFGFNPWYGLVVAVIVAGGTFAFLFTTIQRLNEAARLGRA